MRVLEEVGLDGATANSDLNTAERLDIKSQIRNNIPEIFRLIFWQ